MGLDQMQLDELAIRPNSFRQNGNVRTILSIKMRNIHALSAHLLIHTQYLTVSPCFWRALREFHHFLISFKG